MVVDVGEAASGSLVGGGLGVEFGSLAHALALVPVPVARLGERLAAQAARERALLLVDAQVVA